MDPSIPVDFTSIVALVMAAGKGTRMRSALPKVLHCIAGEPLLGHVLTTVEQMSVPRSIVIVGHGAEEVRAILPERGESVEQREQLGTGHAVLQAEGMLSGFDGEVLILSGDVPLLSRQTLESMIAAHHEAAAALTVLTTDMQDPTGFGRIIRDEAGQLLGIVEQKDATESQRAVREINAGVYLARWTTLLEALHQVGRDNAQGEYYLTDAVRILVDMGRPVLAHKTLDALEVQGINTRLELVTLAAEYQRRSALRWLERGVTIESPGTTWIGPRVELGEDTLVEQGVMLYGRTRVGRSCRIGAYSRLLHVQIGDSVEIRHSDIEDTVIGDGTTIGPFARLRGGAELGRKVRIGNFVEVKGSRFGDGAKAAHLSYLGDATLGAKVNVGAGTITCNYDGERKHRTQIGEGAFIGSNNTLVAPLTVGSHAYTAAGSTITEEVPEGALAIGRSRQVTKAGWVESRKGITP